MEKGKALLKEEGMHADASAYKFAFASFLRTVETPQEKKLWNFLRTKPKGFKFRRQHPFKDYILDFYCHRAKLVIEVDGKQHKNNLEYDAQRTRVVESYGLELIRFENFEIDDHFEKVIEKVTQNM